MITTRINKGNLVNLVRRLCSDNKNKVLVAVKLEENCVEKLDDEMKSEEILEVKIGIRIVAIQMTISSFLLASP